MCPVQTFAKNGAPGGITRRCAPRPSGRRRRTSGVQLGRTAKLSNQLVYVVGSNPAANRHSEVLDKFAKNGAPGGITRRCAPRPSGRRRRTSGVQLGRTAKLSNQLVYVVGSNPAANRHREVLDKFAKNGAPGGIRTHDPRLRRPILYPAELRAQSWGGDTTRRPEVPSSVAAALAVTPYVASRAAACNLRTVAQFRVVTGRSGLPGKCQK